MTGDRITGVTLTVLGVATAAEASTFEVAFMTDPVGPKALPYVVAVALMVAGITAMVRPRESPEVPGRPTSLRVVGAVLAFLAYAPALPFLGFFTSTTLVVTVLALLCRGPAMRALAAAALLSGGLWLLFVRALSLPLPVGELWIR